MAARNWNRLSRLSKNSKLHVGYILGPSSFRNGALWCLLSDFLTCITWAAVGLRRPMCIRCRWLSYTKLLATTSRVIYRYKSYDYNGQSRWPVLCRRVEPCTVCCRSRWRGRRRAERPGHARHGAYNQRLSSMQRRCAGRSDSGLDPPRQKLFCGRFWLSSPLTTAVPAFKSSSAKTKTSQAMHCNIS